MTSARVRESVWALDLGEEKMAINSWSREFMSVAP